MKSLKPISGLFSRSLANQLLSTYLLVLTIALTLVSLFALFVIKSESLNDLRNALEVEAVNLALEIDNDLVLDSEDATNRIQRAAHRHASKLNLSITVVDNDGHVIADSGGKKIAEGENISNQPEISDALAGIAAIYTRTVSATKTDWLYVAYPVRAAGETAGVIRVGVPLTELNKRLNNDLIFFLELIFVAGVVTVLISLWLARRVTQPIRDMSNFSKEITKSGDMSVMVPVDRYDELGELAESFNEMIARLREQERLRQEFIANASHELKTPTMAIGSVVEALQAGASEDPELRKKFLESLENLVERQGSLLEDLLDITMLDTEQAVSWDEKVNLGSVVSDAVEQIRSQAEKKGICLERSSSRNGLYVTGSSIQLQRAFLNLLTNAVNYTSGDGKIIVSLNEPGDKDVEVSIADTGAGIEPEDLPHIFDRFYRGDKARTRAGGGTGLGLAITHEIIKRHNGSVKVSSETGKGSTFTVKLPVAAVSEDSGDHG